MTNDAYEVHYAEKLWELLPGVLRHEDGLGDNPGVLRAFCEIWAREAAKIRRSTDHLWDDALIELCDDWAVPYIGQLVGTRMLGALNPRGNRIAVKKAIHYRRRSGTRNVLEALITDIAGYEGIVTEGFERLARSWHRLDPADRPGADPDNRTPPGGMADLRNPMRLDLARGPFDSFAYRPDLRRPAAPLVPGTGPGRPFQTAPAALDRAGIRKVGFHLYRRSVFQLRGVMPAAAQGTTGFRFDPSGRDVPLYQISTRVSGGNQGLTGTGFPDWRAATQWEVPGPMLCRVLGHALYIVSEAALALLAGEPGFTLARIGQLRLLRGLRLEGDRALRIAVSRLEDGSFFTGAAPLRAIRAATIRPDCGKAGLLPLSVAVAESGAGPVPTERVTAANLAGWSLSAPGFRLAIDPERGRLRFLNAAPANPPMATYAYAMAGPIGAGPYPRPEAVARSPTGHVAGGGTIAAADIPATGILEIDDSATYALGPNQATIRDAVLQAREGERPYLTRGADFLFLSGQDNAELVLDGLWIGATAPVSIRLRGSWRSVRIANCTLDPGGARTADPGSDLLPMVDLVVAGEVDRLEIAQSVLGPVSTSGTGQINRLVIRDSIVQAQPGTVAALAIGNGETILERVTVMGPTRLHRLYATETLLDGLATVRDAQAGCFRFGAYRDGSLLPRPYQSLALNGNETLFGSRRFGAPDYGQISLGAPFKLREGAESGSEIGAFSALNGPIRLQDLHQKAAEFMPFGLQPFFFAET